MYFPQTDINYGIYDQSPGEGSSWEVNTGAGSDPFGLGGLQGMSGGAPLGAEGIMQARIAINNIMARYGGLPDGLPDWVYDVAGGLGEPDGPEMQGEGLSGEPVNIVKRNEAGEQIGIIPGVRIGYGENSRVVTLDELIRINQIRRQSGQDIIGTRTPGFVPVFVDESGAPVNNETVTNTTDVNSDTNIDSSTDSSTDSGSIISGDPATSEGIDLPETTTGGGGFMEFPPGSGVFIPEGMAERAQELINQGVGYRNLANALGLESRNQQDVVGPVNMTDAELNGLTDEGLDPNFTGEFDGQQYENGMLVSSGDTTQTSLSTATGGTSDASSTSEIGDTTLTGGDTTVSTGDTSLTGGDTTVSTGATTLTGGDSTLTGGDLYGGDVSTGDTSLTTGATTLTGGAVTTGPVSTDVSSAGGQGGAGGNVSVNIGGGDGLSSGEITEILETSGITGLIAAFAERGEITPGQLQDIFPEAVSTIKSGAPKEFAEEVIALDREIAPQQAGFATDLYGQITGAVRDAQGPLMQSLARRSEMQGLEAERLMGPLSFLEDRDATQAGYGQAVSGGRGLGNISKMLAGRQRAEQKNVNLQLASNLLGQQRATAGLMADIEGGIYSQIAPSIGIDPNALLNVSGTDIGNRLSLIQSTQRAEAIRDSGDKQLAAEFAGPVVGGLLDLGIGYGKKRLGIT